MKKPSLSLRLPVGNVSLDPSLGKYYQDFSQAIYHFENKIFGDFDESGLPLFGFGDNAVYHQIYIIQFGLISHDLILGGIDVEKHKKRLSNAVNWLENNEEEFLNTTVWRNDFPVSQWELEPGWISGMYQSQIISLYLRYGQMFNEEQKYIEKAQSIVKFFSINYEDGGVRRYDKNGFLWFEEYPSKKPSFVLNGFIYALLGLYDLWRITKDNEVKQTIDQCVNTLTKSIHLYDSGYWSIYDQLKKELATKYYHRNIHIPLMEILYKLTGEEIFNNYKIRWEKQLNSKLSNLWVRIMYRVQPRLRNFSKK